MQPDPVPMSGYAACMELRTERLRLRPPDAERDLTDIVAAASDAEMARYLPTMPSPYTVADAERWLGGRVASGWTGGEEKTFVIRNGSDDTFLGVVTVRVKEGVRRLLACPQCARPGSHDRGRPRGGRLGALELGDSTPYPHDAP